jgi:hypothetical protein
MHGSWSSTESEESEEPETKETKEVDATSISESPNPLEEVSQLEVQSDSGLLQIGTMARA